MTSMTAREMRRPVPRDRIPSGGGSVRRAGAGKEAGPRSAEHFRTVRIRTSVLALTSMLAAGLLTVPVNPVEAKAPRAELARETSVSAAHTAGIAVRLPRPARLSARPFENPDVALEGGGRIVAAALVKEPVSPGSPQWVAARWPWCSASGCKPADRTVVEALNWEPRRFDGDDLILPSGAYRLYLLTPERSATATLTLRGLSGRAALRASEAAFGASGRADATTPDATSDTGEVRAALDQQELPADGLHLFAAAVETADRNHGGYVLTECLTDTDGTGPERPPGSCTAHQGADTGGPRILDEIWSYRTIERGAHAATVSFEQAHTAAPRRRIRLAWAWLAYQ